MLALQFGPFFDPKFCFNLVTANVLMVNLKGGQEFTKWEMAADGRLRLQRYRLYRSAEASAAIPCKRAFEKKGTVPGDAILPTAGDIPKNNIGGVTPAELYTVVFNSAGVPTDTPTNVSSTGVPAGYYFWAYVGSSVCDITSGGAVAAGARVAIEDATGKIDDNAFSADNLFGRAIEVASGADIDIAVELDADI